MAFSYPAAEKLKSKKIIDLLFTEGKSVSKYPLRLVYVAHNFEEKVPLKIGVSVSKKYFKKAVDRNYFKRLLRESYRLNKHLLVQQIDAKYCCMFFYQTNEKLSFSEINEKTIQLFEKFIKVVTEEKNQPKN
jgi:ribonuclease P protein component